MWHFFINLLQTCSSWSTFRTDSIRIGSHRWMLQTCRRCAERKAQFGTNRLTTYSSSTWTWWQYSLAQHKWQWYRKSSSSSSCFWVRVIKDNNFIYRFSSQWHVYSNHLPSVIVLLKRLNMSTKLGISLMAASLHAIKGYRLWLAIWRTKWRDSRHSPSFIKTTYDGWWWHWGIVSTFFDYNFLTFYLISASALIN